jgi:hypothetical protein
MRTLIILLLAVGALALGLWVWHAQVTKPLPPVTELQIIGIDFPKQINADGNDVKGLIHFQAPTGKIVQADFEVVQADLFSPFSFDPQIQGEQRGSFEFFISILIPQQVTLRVTLTDDQGQKSPPKEFSFVAAAATTMPMPQNP